jgi:cobalamin biosynthesis protein CobT
MGDVKSSRAQIENGEKIGITTIGIGIFDDVSAVYRKSVKIESLNDLASTSFKQIKLAV